MGNYYYIEKNGEGVGEMENGKYERTLSIVQASQKQSDRQASALTINDNFFAPHFNLFDSDARFFDISVISV